MNRLWTRTLTATLCMLILVLPAMASETPNTLNYSHAAGHSHASESEKATEGSIGAQGNNLSSATVTPVDYSALLDSWQPAAGYQSPQMTNMGEERVIDFQGHDLGSLTDGVAVGSILYAPSEADNPTFRSDVAACSGATVDYFDARVGTPSVALLATYDCVLTWANFGYADATGFGNNLAAYVDGGGKVILGQWTYFSDQTNGLAGAIMTAAYCPVTTSTSFDIGAYNNDGTDCVHGGVSAYDTSYLDRATPIAGAFSDGTFNNPSNSLAVAWRADRMVYYSPGNTGAFLGTGQWAQLLCNMCMCNGGGGGDVDCVCDAAWDVGDRVTATVDNPQGATGILTGHGGTVVGGALSGFPVLLISWDNWQLGHDGNGVALCPVTVTLPDTSGWFVDCPDVTPEVAGGDLDCVCAAAYSNGDRVEATVDNPGGASGILAGHQGTVYCGADPVLWGTDYILICWDNWTLGHYGNGFCYCPPLADMTDPCGWFVGCADIQPTGTGGSTIAVALDATPDTGFTPFTTIFSATLANLTTTNRRAAARIDATLANGTVYGSWRAGYTNLSGLEIFNRSWSVNIPALPPVFGVNTFELSGEDVTPAPFNQPPYAPSGDTDNDVATVTAF